MNQLPSGTGCFSPGHYESSGSKTRDTYILGQMNTFLEVLSQEFSKPPGAAPADFLQPSTYLSLSKLGCKELNKLNLCFHHLPGEAKGTLDACCNGE